jgi:diadenosine tetraphosphate (Ap4A) HIT family hydrolase
MNLKRVLFQMARSQFAAFFVGFAFEHLTALMPLERLWENKQGIIFKHPAPSYQTHWLAVPKMRIRSFAAIDFADNDVQQTILELFEGLVKTAVSHNITPYTIIINGGHYQDVPQLHFHLISGLTAAGKQWEPNLTGIPLKKCDLGDAQGKTAVLQQAHQLINQQSPPAYRIQIHLNQENTSQDGYLQIN